MRWNQQSALDPTSGADAGSDADTEAGTEAAGADAPPAELFGLKGLVRSVRTPEFAGVTFHEVLAKSALNKVPAASSMPFTWTINPYRGCSHACVYCFTRSTHRYLDLDSVCPGNARVFDDVNPAWVRAVAVGGFVAGRGCLCCIGR